MDIETILKQIIAVESTSALSNEPIVDLIISLVDSHDVAAHKLPSHQEGKFNLLLTKGKQCSGLTFSKNDNKSVSMIIEQSKSQQQSPKSQPHSS